MNEWTPINDKDRASERADPYFHWAKATDYVHYFKVKGEAEVFPVILELGITAEQFATGDKNHWKPPEDWKQWISVPPVYAKPSLGLNATTYCTASVTKQFFDELDSSLRDVVKRIGIGVPLRSQITDSAGKPGMPEDKLKAGSVVMGIIDDGLAFAHKRFRRNNATRIEFFWNQDAVADRVAGFGYGRELHKREINSWLEAADHAGVVDEDQVYRLAKHVDYTQPGHKPLAWRRTHGTHVMDLACGFDPGEDVETRPIICVQLPVATTADTSGRTLAVHVLDGLRYILARADVLAQNGAPLPVVVNLSYGMIAGPHDGSSILERAMDELIGKRRDEAKAKFAIVLPSGNSRQARCHASLEIPKEPTRFNWRALPDDSTPNYVEIWLPPVKDKKQEISIAIKPPTGSVSPPIHKGDIYQWKPRGKDVLAQVLYRDAVAGSRHGSMILVAIAPTVTRDAEHEVAPSGKWEIVLNNPGAPVTIEAWIQRDDAPYGYPRGGRQSRFEDAKYQHRQRDKRGREVDDDKSGSWIKRDGTINAIATGKETIAVGGFRRKDGRPAHYSAGGNPPKAPAITAPDAMAVSDESETSHGVFAAGARSGAAVAMNGTSVAAPQITRWVADRMEKGCHYDRKALAKYAEEQEEDPDKRPPKERGGGGRIDDRPKRERDGPGRRRFD